MLLALIGLGITALLFFVYCLLAMSSRYSRMEEADADRFREGGSR